jgi:hypothetical protein
MATQSREPTAEAESERGLLGQIEVHSIDWIPDTERHGFSYTGYYHNPVTNGVDYSWVVGLLVSGLVYLVLSRSLNLASEQAAISASERELQTIDVATEAVRDGE